MLVLALDTTTRPGSVALADEHTVIADRQGDPLRTHAEDLPGGLLALLEAHGLTTASIDLFAVASGPGSFTGLRVGIATMQGLALVSGRRIVGVSILDALGQLASIEAQPAATVAAWVDAHRGDVFAALYRVTAAAVFLPERLTLVDGPLVGSPSSVLARWALELNRAPAVWIGDGATTYADTITGTIGPAPIVAHPLLAGVVGRLAIVRAGRGEGVHPAAVRPLYVRRPDAEIDRDRRNAPQWTALARRDNPDIRTS
jgi:tRNA threonylcarbamoyladenosine biosynthesis protein TsaB